MMVFHLPCVPEKLNARQILQRLMGCGRDSVLNSAKRRYNFKASHPIMKEQTDYMVVVIANERLPDASNYESQDERSRFGVGISF